MAPDQFNIDRSQQSAVDKSAVLGPVGIVDPVSAAKGVERIRRTGMLAPSECQRVDDARHADGVVSRLLQLRIEKSEIKTGIVNNQPVVGDKFEKGVRDIGKQRFSAQELG